MSIIDWNALESLVDSLDQIWYETESGRNRSRELRAIHELGKCDLATQPALCFFAGRMVEVSVAKEWARFQIAYGFSNLGFSISIDEQINHLQQVGRLDERSVACIHEVRKLGNMARHHAMFPSESQAAFSLAMLKVALPWMAGEDRGSVGRACDSHSITVLDQEVSWLLNVTNLANPAAGIPELMRHAPTLLETINRTDAKSYPTQVTNWVTQHCIDAKRFDLAGALIAPFLQNDDPDAPQLRLDRDRHLRVSHFNRLVALRLSRVGNPQLAIEFLTSLAKRAGYLADDGLPVPLHSQNSHAYAETLGILAGARKTLWMHGNEPTDLDHIARLYQNALQAEPWNSYLAINAAACSAWSGEIAAAQSLSGDLLKRLMPSTLARDGKDVASLWHLLTRAEALLIGGQHSLAVEGYSHANQLFGATHAGDFERAHQQVCIHAKHNLLDTATQEQITRALESPNTFGPR